MHALSLIRKNLELAKQLFSFSSPETNEEDEATVISNYRQFVSLTLEHYRCDLTSPDHDMLTRHLYYRLWKNFLDELLAEQYRLYSRHVQGTGVSASLRPELENITSEALLEFRKLGPQII